jgi:molybdate transport system regulatory protein
MTTSELAKKPSLLAKKPSLTLRVYFDEENRIGPGKIKLLETIHGCGSISEAGRQLNMSYHYAWDLVNELNCTFKEPSVIGQVGGDDGGGAKLTPFGLELIARYRSIERSVEDAVRSELDDLQSDLGFR